MLLTEPVDQAFEVRVDSEGQIHVIMPPRRGADAWVMAADEAEKMVEVLGAAIQSARRIEARSEPKPSQPIGFQADE